MYGGLHGFYVVIIWIIFEPTVYFDIVFITLITIAYLSLFLSKYSLSRVLKLETKTANSKKVKFIRAIKDLEQADMLLSVSKFEINGQYFYSSSYQRTSIKGLLFNNMNSEVIKNSYYAQSPLGSKQMFIMNSYNDKSQFAHLEENHDSINEHEDGLAEIHMEIRSHHTENDWTADFEDISPIGERRREENSSIRMSLEEEYKFTYAQNSESFD